MKCLTKSEELKIPRELRGPSQDRTLLNIKGDYQRFVAAGANHDKAKEFNNVMAPHFFDIEINQVKKGKSPQYTDTITQAYCCLGVSTRTAHHSGNIL